MLQNGSFDSVHVGDFHISGDDNDDSSATEVTKGGDSTPACSILLPVGPIGPRDCAAICAKSICKEIDATEGSIIIEIVLVDDGNKDGSVKVIRDILQTHVCELNLDSKSIKQSKTD